MGEAPGGWDLSDLDGAAGPRAQRSAVARARALAARARRLRPSSPAREFGRALRGLEESAELASMVAARASLARAADTQSDAAAAAEARAERAAAEIANLTLPFVTWWRRGVDARNARRLASGAGELRWHLEHARATARHSLGEAEERALNTTDVTGAGALVRIYDRVTGSFRYDAGGRRGLAREQLSALFRSPSARDRRGAYRALLSRYAAERGVLGEIYQNVALRWRDEEVGMRGHRDPISARNTANQLDGRTVSGLLRACAGGAGAFREYFALKARSRGARRLSRYDLYAPPPRARPRRWPYAEAVREVLGALSGLGPEAAGWARAMLDAGHVDHGVRPGKRDGAFCSTPSPRVLPYVMLSYTGRQRDVFTLAHEMGHAVHSMAASRRSALVQHAVLPLAEAASTLSEALLHDRVSSRLPPAQRRAALADRVEDLYATILRQAHFTSFEAEAHRMVAGGATPAELSSEYARGLRAQLGAPVSVDAAFAVEWASIPHFYHAPFYCYSYSFGCLLALSLFERLRAEGPSFAPVIMDLLAAGGSEKPEDMLRSRGLGSSPGRLWGAGFAHVRGLVRELRGLS